MKTCNVSTFILHFLLLPVLLCLSFTSVKQDTIDRLAVKGPLNFADMSYSLAWSDKPNENYYVQEYLPTGETLESFNQMLTINVFITDLSAADALVQKVQGLVKRRVTDAICSYKVSEGPDGKEFILDFLVGESKDNKMTIAEFNVYHYKEIQLEGGRNGILIYAYSKRSYGEGITPFLKELPATRTGYINHMISSALPVIKISGT